MSDVKLLPCPFCGGEMRRDYNGAAFVHPAADSSPCPSRYVEGYTDEDITAWNTRANLAERDAEVEALRAERDRLYQQAIDNATVAIENEARAERLAEALRGLSHAGTLLSNIAYNLAQDESLSEPVRWSLDDARKRWDLTTKVADAHYGGAQRCVS